MKSIFCFFIFFSVTTCLAQGLVGGYWITTSFHIENIDNELVPTFIRDHQDNLIDYSKAKFQFNPNGSLIGVNMIGDPLKGSYDFDDENKLIIGNESITVRFLDNNTVEFKTTEVVQNPFNDSVLEMKKTEILKRVNDCVPLTSHKNSSIPPDTFYSDSIVSNSKALLGGRIEYFASKFIELLPGFDSKEAIFEADIKQCPYE